MLFPDKAKSELTAMSNPAGSDSGVVVVRNTAMGKIRKRKIKPNPLDRQKETDSKEN